MAAQVHEELLVQVQDALRAVRTFKGRPPARTSVPPGAIGVLAAIDAAGGDGLNGKELAARCALDPSTISRAVAALVRSGLVLRTADPVDGRASVLAVSAEGRRVLDDVRGWYADRLAEALTDWTDQDVRALSGLLHRFSEDLLARFHHQTLEAAR